MTLYKTVNGQQVALTQAEIDEFNNSQPTDLDLLDKEKEIKKLEIADKCHEFIYQNVNYNGADYINSNIAYENLDIKHAICPEPISWLDANNNSLQFTKQQACELLEIMIARRDSGYTQEATMITYINSITDPADIDLVKNYTVNYT